MTERNIYHICTLDEKKLRRKGRKKIKIIIIHFFFSKKCPKFFKRVFPCIKLNGGKLKKKKSQKKTRTQKTKKKTNKRKKI